MILKKFCIRLNKLDINKFKEVCCINFRYEYK